MDLIALSLPQGTVVGRIEAAREIVTKSNREVENSECGFLYKNRYLEKLWNFHPWGFPKIG